MANALGWSDFNKILSELTGSQQHVQDLYRVISVLKVSKEAIWGDAERKANLKEIVDVHPDYSITSLGTQYNKLITLKTWLEDNGYVQSS